MNSFRLALGVVRNIVAIRRLVWLQLASASSQGTYRGQENSLHNGTLSPSIRYSLTANVFSLLQRKRVV